MHHRMKEVAKTLLSEVECQLHDLSCVDTKEMGEVIDMIKDLTEAIYYETIIKAMEEGTEHDVAYYKDKRYPGEPDYYGFDKMPYDKEYPRHMKDKESMSPYMEKDMWEPMQRDEREGHSHLSRKAYMESKEMHHDQAKKMQELEKYVQELSKDITEMISDASPEEKQLLKTKVATLATKIA